MTDEDAWRYTVGLAVVIAFLLSACTAWYALYADQMSGLGQWLLGFLTLRRENNLASWFSAMLLFIAGLLCYDAHSSIGNDQRRLRRSFFLLALIFVGLSLDEAGSIHERIELHEYGTGLVLAPIAVALAAIAAYGLSSLWRHPGYRRSAGGMVIAFGLFATVPIQEQLGHEIVQSPMGEALFGTLEEATELAGSLLLLAMAGHASKVARGRVDGAGLSASAANLRTSVVVAAIVVLPLLAYWTAGVVDDFRGHPADWAMSVLFLMAAVVDLHNTRDIAGSQRLIRLSLLAVASMTMAFPPTAELLSGSGISRRAAIIGLAVLGLSVHQRIFRPDRRGNSIVLGAGAVVFLAAYEASASNEILLYLLSQGIALFTYLVLCQGAQRPAADAVQPVAPTR